MGAVLIESDGLLRRWEYSAPEGGATYTIEYGGGNARPNSVAVNGEVVAVNYGVGYTGIYAFELGKFPAALEVKHDRKMKIKSLRLTVSGSTAYSEGEAMAYAGPEGTEQAEEKPQLAEQIQIERTPDEVEISYREPTMRGVGLAALGLLMLAAGLFFYFGIKILPIWLIAAWVLFGLWTLYMGVVKLTNRTKIHLNRQEFRLRYEPLPAWGRKSINQPAGQMLGFTTRLISRKSGNTRNYLYTLVARTQNGDDVVLMEDQSQAVIVAIRNSLAKFQEEVV